MGLASVTGGEDHRSRAEQLLRMMRMMMTKSLLI